jgi:ketose-bisphosphate aldolase
MSLVSFNDLMKSAEEKKYAVGYFECWNLDSLLAVKDAAEATKSPVIMGFNGIWLPDKNRPVKDPLGVYAKLVNDVCKEAKVPCCSIFNESPYLDIILESIEDGYSIVMYSNSEISYHKLLEGIIEVVNKAHKFSVAVEGEMNSMLGEGGKTNLVDYEKILTSPSLAKSFVEETKIDALAVSIGQAHYHGRKEIHLDIKRLNEIKDNVRVPLVLHGGSYINSTEMKKAIEYGIRKINIGSILKNSYFTALRQAILKIKNNYNPYMTLGSGYESDVLVKARVALQKTVENLMNQYGCEGKAW